MIKHPIIKPGDWIDVGIHNCVVQFLYPENRVNAVCQVVYYPAKPTTSDVDWDGEKWFFPDHADFGGYGKDHDPYVIQLKRGRYT